MLKTDNRFIQRNKLMAMLNVLTEEKILYVCAPAGYGKSVAVRQWLDQCGCASAIITLDEYDNDTAHFCRGFCAALCDCQPENAELLKIVSHPSFDSAPDEYSIRALAKLSNTKKTCLAIDDLHFVYDERALRLLLSFMNRLPERFQIVLISRNVLPTEFSGLWLKGNLARLTADDLRFSHEDIIQLYAKRGYPIGQGKADEVYKLTDGWAIAIGALLLSGGEPHGDSLEHLDEFIRANVWLRWDEATREFILKTSLIGELTPSLCAALTDEPDCEAVLERLVQHNIFISRTKQGVYRYHRLFRDFLHKMPELHDMEISLLDKAGYWYLKEQNFHSAMEFFTKSKNCDGIVKCLDLLSVSSHEFASIEKLLPIADSPLVQDLASKHPYIYSFLVWITFNKGCATDMAYYADRYYENQSKIIRLDPRFASTSILILLIDYRNSLSDLKRSVVKILILALRMKLSGIEADLGIINQNMPLMHRGTRDVSECAMGDIEANVLVVAKLLRGLLGGYGAILIGCLTAGLLYEKGHLQKAYSRALSAIAEVQEHFSAESKFIAMATLVYILDASEQHEQGDNIIKQIASMIEQYDAYYLNYNFQALITRRALADGDIKAARNWLCKHEGLQHNNLNFYKLYGYLTTCRAYITNGVYDSAVILLTKVLALAQSYNRPLDIIEAQILLSIAYWKKKGGFQDEAIRYLEQAVLLAYPYGYTQLFVNEGAELAGMLLRLRKRVEQHVDENVPPASFVKILHLKALEHQKCGLTSGQSEKFVKFTDKQKDVIKLICEGKSYREITDELGITRPTLRSHIAAIYSKLGVTNQIDAIKKIKVLELMEKAQG